MNSDILNKYFRAAALAGLILGLLSSIPYVRNCNVVCFIWVLAGGTLATILLRNEYQMPNVDIKDGAISGLLAGLIGALVSTVVDTVQWVLFKDRFIAELVTNLRSNDSVPVEAKSLVLAIVRDSPYLLIFLSLVMHLILFSIFATLGGILGVRLIRIIELANEDDE